MRAMKCIVWLPWRTVLYLTLLRSDLLALLYLLCSAGIALLCLLSIASRGIANEIEWSFQLHCIALFCNW